MPLGKVWFIGAGPGDPELITVKGQRLIQEADLVLYAGSLVPQEVVACAKEDALVVDSAPLSLEQTHELLCTFAFAGKMVARVHTGDPGLYGAVQEQKALLDAEKIPSEIVPGVSAAFAAAAAAGVSLTTPEHVQSFSITRLEGRTPVPMGQRVQDYAAHGGTLAVYLSAGDVAGLCQELRQANVAENTPIVLAYRVGWPDQRICWATLATLEATAIENKFTRQTIFLVLPAAHEQASAQSKLYARSFSHGYRQAK